MSLGRDDLQRLQWAGLLHDVGKVGVPARVLNKQGRLTADEWEQIKQHPAIGARLTRPLEPWLGDLHKFVEGGGSLGDVKKRLADHGLAVASAIGFAEWIVDDDAKRAAALEIAKKDMAAVAAIGGTHIAALSQ